MKRFLTNAGFGAAIALCAFALPGRADTTLQFSFSGVTAGSVQDTISNGQISSLTSPNFLRMTVSGAAQYNGTWSFSTASFVWDSGTDSYQLTVTGTGSCTTCGNGTLGNNPTNVNFGASPIVTINLAATPVVSNVAGSSPNQTGSILINNATSISESTTLLTDLGLTPPSLTTVASGAALTLTNGTTNSPSAGQETFAKISSGSFSLVMTPEPGTWAMVAGGFLLVAFLARRKTSAAAPVVAE